MPRTTWEGLARRFVRVVVPYSFLASSPVVLRLVADIGPVQLGASYLAAVVSGLGIGIVYLKLGGANRQRQIRWFQTLGIVFVVVMPIYVFLESTFVYRTDPPSFERRVRGCIYTSDIAREYVNERGSVREALKGNMWQSDGLFTEASRNVVGVSLFVLWNCMYVSLCGAIATLALIEAGRKGRRGRKKPKEPPSGNSPE